MRGLGIRNLFSFLVSKETMVLRRWESKTFKCGFNIRVDRGRIITVKDFDRNPFFIQSDDGLTLEMSAFQISHDGN